MNICEPLYSREKVLESCEEQGVVTGGDGDVGGGEKSSLLLTRIACRYGYKTRGTVQETSFKVAD
jgi:hypothetical protein